MENNEETTERPYTGRERYITRNLGERHGIVLSGRQARGARNNFSFGVPN